MNALVLSGLANFRVVGKPEVMARIGSPGITSALSVIRPESAKRDCLQNPGTGLLASIIVGPHSRSSLITSRYRLAAGRLSGCDWYRKRALASLGESWLNLSTTEK